jgi:hypothetical protein
VLLVWRQQSPACSLARHCDGGLPLRRAPRASRACGYGPSAEGLPPASRAGTRLIFLISNFPT